MAANYVFHNDPVDKMDAAKQDIQFEGVAFED
jgi:hypothetical protein